jgi:signal transduction histidine kinase
MRLALKSTLAFLAIYLLVVGGVAWWMAGQLQALADGMAESTAQLVGGEVARALADSAVEQLQRSDDATRARLAQIVDDVTEHSGILTSVAIVDRGGKVIAGDNVELGRQLAIPEVIFGADNSVRLVSAQGPFGGGMFYMLVPLKAGKELAGYLRLEMRSERIAHLYSRATRNLVLVALAGLLAVGATGLLLHVQLSRRSEALAHALEGAVRGDAVAGGPRDEFARALNVARRVGRELTEARGERSQTQQRMGALMKALDVGVLMLETDFRLGFANRRAADLLGAREPTELARRWDAEFLPRLTAEIPCRFAGAAAGRRVELEWPASGGSPRIKLEFYELGEGSCEGFVVLVKSAESLEALQSELGLAIQMRGLTRFYAAFAHDLKAPLNAMVMTLELLKLSVQSDAHDDATHAKELKYVEVLNEEIRRLDRQLRSLLSHTAPPSEGRHEVDLRTLLQDLDALLGPQAKRQRVTLTTRLPDEPVTLVGQADRLKQAMLNILINALEAMPDGGALSMALERRNGTARISVQDNGPGIPPELLGAIYEMHFTTKSGGTGVGLYVARSVMQAHGGTIEVHSTPRHGTSFTLTLPVPSQTA